VGGSLSIMAKGDWICTPNLAVRMEQEQQQKAKGYKSLTSDL